MNNGKKISSKYLDPIDNKLYDLSFVLGKYFYKLHFTPNMITTISLVFALIGIYNIHITNYKTGAVLFFINYFFDCMDGSYARTYNMTSKFGDIYDHISDWIKVSLLIITFITLDIKFKIKIIIGIISVILLVTTSIQIGLEEKIKNSDSGILTFFKNISINYDTQYIHYFKYLGSGVTNLIVCLIIFNLKNINNLI
jgi:phosphatidylglycerophosphate synthase